MSIFIEKDGKKRLSRSFCVKILVFFGLICASAITIQPLQLVLINKMTNIRDNFIAKLENFTGMEIRYSSIRPAFFGSFDVRNLRLIKNDSYFFTASRISIKYSVIDLIMQRSSFIHTIAIEKPVLKMDTQRDMETFNIITSLMQNREEFKTGDGEVLKQLSLILPKDADYQIINGHLSLTDNYTVYSVDNLNLNIKREQSPDNNGDIIIDGKFIAQILQEGINNNIITIKTELGISARCDDGLENGSADLDFLYITCSEKSGSGKAVSFFNPAVNLNEIQKELFTVFPFAIAVGYENKVISINKESEEGAFYFYYDAENNRISSGINLDNFSFQDKIILYNYLEDINHLLDLKISGSSWIKFEDSKTDYTVDLSAGNTQGELTDAILINAAGNKNSVNIRNLLIASSGETSRAGFFKGKAGFTGNINFSPLNPSGRLTFENFSLGQKNEFNALFNVTSRGRDIKIASQTIRAADARIESLDINLYPTDRELSFSVFLAADENEVAYLDAVYNSNPRQLEASVSLKSMSIFNLTQMASPFTDFLTFPVNLDMLNNSYIDTDVFISTDFNNIVYNAPAIVFNIGDIDGFLSVSGTDHQLTLSEGVFKRNDNDLLVTANINFSNPMDLIFGLNASYQDLFWNAQGQILDRKTIMISDPNGLNVYGNIDNSGVMSGYIQGTNFPFAAAGKTIYLNFYSTLRYTSMDFWNFDINSFKAHEITGAQNNEFLSISGTADQDGASFREIIYTDSEGILLGSADFAWDSDFSYLELVMNVTDGYEAGEFYNIEGVLKDGQIGVNMQVSNMHLDRFFNIPYPVKLSADADIIWNSIKSFDAKINLTSFNTKIDKDNIDASVALNLTNDELSVKNLRFDYAQLKTVMPELKINRKEGFANMNANISGFELGRYMEGSLALDINFDEIDSWMNILQSVNDFNGTFVIDDVQYGDLKEDRIAFSFSRNMGAVTVTGGIDEMLRLEMDPFGNIFVGLSSPFPVRGAFAGTLKGREFNLHCSNYFVDISSLYYLLGSSTEFTIISGFATGQMEVKGDILNPEFHGFGVVSSLGVRVPEYLGDDVRIVPFRLAAEGNEMTFGPADIVCGAGGGSVDGWLLFQNWKPINIGLEIAIPRETPIPYDFNITGFLAAGNASGNLNLNVDNINDMIDIRGNLFTNDADLSLSMEDTGASGDNSDDSYNAFVDLVVTTGAMVEFIWPAASPIIRANPEMGTVIRISSDTQAGQFNIHSDVRIRAGEVFYLDRSFYIRQGNIVFRENETSFNPIFSARAEVRDRVDEGPVTISMIVNNQPLLNFEPRFEASPSLTQLEIYSILGQNFSNIQGEENTDQAQRVLLTSTTDLVTQLIASSDILSQFVFFRQFERQIRDTLRMDMFSVRTRFLHNAVITGAMGQGTTGVGNYFDNTTVFMGKYIGQHMFVHGMLTMRYDETSSLFGGLRFEPDIGIELQSPFINIRWEFFPLHPENWWVTDHSITLTWSKSF